MVESGLGKTSAQVRFLQEAPTCGDKMDQEEQKRQEEQKLLEAARTAAQVLNSAAVIARTKIEAAAVLASKIVETAAELLEKQNMDNMQAMAVVTMATEVLKLQSLVDDMKKDLQDIVNKI